MTEHDKLALLNMINKASEALQQLSMLNKASEALQQLSMLNKASEEDDDENDLLSTIDYFKLKSCWHEIIHALIHEAEAKGYKVIWEGFKVVDIVEKEGKEDEN